ncbi:MAG: hypothetical protein K0U52_08410 [Gammaproteobacteria bacterium]|nr:hypothetical protein [Gammaproteobacteria bacterium]
MGSFLSSISGYWSVWTMMSTATTLRMHDDMRDQFAQVGAFHEQKALQQLLIAGAVGGNNPLTNQGTYGNQAAFWVSFAEHVKAASRFFIPIGIFFAVAAWLADWNPVIVFFGIFIALFFAIYAFQHITATGRGYISSAQPFIVSMVSALILSGVVTLILLS